MLQSIWKLQYSHLFSEESLGEIVSSSRKFREPSTEMDVKNCPPYCK